MSKARQEGRVVGAFVYDTKKAAESARAAQKPKGKAPAKPKKKAAPAPRGTVFEQVLSPKSGTGFWAVGLDLDDFVRKDLTVKKMESGTIQSVSVTLKPGLFSEQGSIVAHAAVYRTEREGRTANSLTVATVSAIKPAVRVSVKAKGATFTVPMPAKGKKIFAWYNNDEFGYDDRTVLYIKLECLGRDPEEQKKLQTAGFVAAEVKVVAVGKDVKVLDYLLPPPEVEEDGPK